MAHKLSCKVSVMQKFGRTVGRRYMPDMDYFHWISSNQRIHIITFCARIAKENYRILVDQVLKPPDALFVVPLKFTKVGDSSADDFL